MKIFITVLLFCFIMCTKESTDETSKMINDIREVTTYNVKSLNEMDSLFAEMKDFDNYKSLPCKYYEVKNSNVVFVKIPKEFNRQRVDTMIITGKFSNWLEIVKKEKGFVWTGSFGIGAYGGLFSGFIPFEKINADTTRPSKS